MASQSVQGRSLRGPVVSFAASPRTLATPTSGLLVTADELPRADAHAAAPESRSIESSWSGRGDIRPGKVSVGGSSNRYDGARGGATGAGWVQEWNAWDRMKSSSIAAMQLGQVGLIL
jgi:hypothetical protein